MKTKILIVEHDSNDMELIQNELKKGNVSFIAEIVHTKKEYENAIHNFKPDIILSNYTFPSFDGPAAFKIKEKLVPQTPFIFVSESIGEGNSIELIKNGVSDFVLKESLSTLTTKLNRALQQAELAKANTILKQSEEKKVQELFQSEVKFRTFFDNSMDGMLLTITDGQILAANPAACKIFQMTEEEIIDSGRFGLVDLTDPRLKILLEERQKSGRAMGELTLVRKDGSAFPGELNSVMFKDDNGEERTSMIVRDITQRKETEQKLSFAVNSMQQALNDLDNILNSSLDIICSIDKEGKFVSVSAASEPIWGYRPDELIGKKYIDFVLTEDTKTTLATDTSIKSGVPVTMFENRYLHKDGHIVPMLWSSRWDEKDQMSYGIAKDATEKKKLEKAFEIERQRFMDLYLQAPSCMGILKGPNHVFEMANPLYLQLIEKEDIIGKTVKEVLPELEAQGIFEFLDTVYTTGKTFSANEMLVKFDFHGNGKLVDTYLNFIYQAHRSLHGEIDGILFFAIDVTEQVLSRKKIEESEKRYAELIQNSPIATYSCDAQGRIIIYNKAAAALWGKEPEIGKDLWCGSSKIYNLDGIPIQHDKCPMALALKGEKDIASEEIIIERPSGERRHVVTYPVPFIDGNGHITGAVNVLTDITENKAVQQVLKESEKKYRQIVETAQEGIWLVDANSKTTFVNDKMCEILEYSPEKMMGKDIYYFMDDEGKQIASKLMEKKKEGMSDQRHHKFIAKSGKEIWVRISANPIFDDDGVYKGSLAMVTDITEFKQAQLALIDSEKKYRFLFESNPMPMWIIDESTSNFLDVNEMAILRYGYSRDEFLSMSAVNIRPEEEKERFIQLMTSDINETDANKGIWNHLKKDGTNFPVEIIAQKIIYEGSKAQIILSNDVTERKKAELNLELRNKEIRDYKFALDESSIVGITDEKGIIIFANDNFCEISQYSREELIGQDHRIISSGYHPKEYIRNLWETLADGKTWKGELKNKAKDGTFYWVDTTIIPFLDEQGKPYQYFATRFNITERKKADLILEKQNEELANQYEEKKNRATELLITNNELRKTNSELDRFVYSVSHDLRSPLTSILGLLSFIEEETQEDDTLEHSKMIRNSINRLDNFIKNILSYSRNNRMILEIEKIPVQQTVATIVDSLHSMKEAKGIHFEIDIQELQPFYSDSLRFKTIIENLISNAIKYHKKDQVDRFIKITAKSTHDELELTVADNGIGISPVHHNKIFDMFFRISGNVEGSGIGLYIVKETIDKLEGSILVQSEPGTGTTFTITLKNLMP